MLDIIFRLTKKLFASKRLKQHVMHEKSDAKVTRANAVTRTSYFQGHGKPNFLLMKLYIN